MGQAARWPRLRPPPSRDAVAALVAFAAAAALQSLTAAPTGTPAWFAGPGPAALAALGAMTLPLATRTVAPVAGLAAASLAFHFAPGQDPPWSLLPAAVVWAALLHRAAGHRPAAVSVPLALGAVALEVVAKPEPRASDTVLSAGLVLVVAGAGWTGRRWRLAEAERLRAAVAAERARIVRELNDLVAHQVLGIVLQAGAGRAVARPGPALAGIEAAAREALVAMRRMLRLLRRPADLPSPAPAAWWAPGVPDAALAVAPLLLVALSQPEVPAPGEAGLLDLVLAGDSARTLPPLVTTVLALLVRRRAPLSVLAVVAAAQVWYGAAGGDETLVGTAVLIATYTAGARLARPTGPAVLRAAPVVVAAMAALGGTSASGLPAGVDRGPVVAAMPVAYGVGLLARMLWDRRARRAAAADEATVADGRTLLARELHDVVAHHVSGIVVQAGAAAADPSTAGAALDGIETSARAALAGLRQLLDGPAGPLAPQPRLADVGGLVDGARAAGLSVVTETVVAATPALGAELELFAYRLVQEGLTNCLRHAPGTTVEVLVRYDRRTLTVRVRDRGGRAATAVGRTDPGGYGLLGLRERVDLLGGTLATGARPGGGWQVAATVPVRAGEEERRCPSAS